MLWFCKKHNAERKRGPLIETVTQNMKYGQSRINYALKYGVAKTPRRYDRPRSAVCFRLERCGGTIEFLADRSRRPFAHPNAHTDAVLKDN